MALRRYIEETWRRVSLRHGFVEVDGPTFEYLDLYKVKSGDEIVSQLFHFESRGEDKKEFALRPEFTPTLARMIAAKANSLPRPIKWFSIPRCYRSERQQKGRLREFIQWNVDIVGDASINADVEIIALCVDALREFGLTTEDVRVEWNNREMLVKALTEKVTTAERIPAAFRILDKIGKLRPEDREKLYIDEACSEKERMVFEGLHSIVQKGLDVIGTEQAAAAEDFILEFNNYFLEMAKPTAERLKNAGLGKYSRAQMMIVRGLAYYTGLVFEVFDKSGASRAIAGGGRYDKLIEMFGGPSLPAVGFGMGDVVLENILREKGKLPVNLVSAPDVFVVSVLDDPAPAYVTLSELRTSQWNPEHTKISQTGLSAVSSYKTTKNIGKLLQEASASGAKLALILAPAEYDRGIVKLKNLATREEKEIPKDQILAAVRAALQRGP
jgi:histidyl-tRNA synthetase